MQSQVLRVTHRIVKLQLLPLREVKYSLAIIFYNNFLLCKQMLVEIFLAYLTELYSVTVILQTFPEKAMPCTVVVSII